MSPSQSAAPQQDAKESSLALNTSAASTVAATSSDIRERAARTTAEFRDIYPFAPNFIAADGGFLHYVDEGPKDAPVLLALHGNPSWSLYWRKLVAAFAGEYRVILVDHMGCGLSSRPSAWRFDLAGHIANIERLVDELQLKDITLAVHDWGGAIGSGFAVRHPELIARMVVMNTAAFPLSWIPWRIAFCRTPLLGRLIIQGCNGFAAPATFMAVEQRMPRALRQAYLAPYRSWGARQAHWRFVMDIPLAADHPSWGQILEVSGGLERLKMKPMILLWGERDWCFTPRFRGIWEERFPAAEVHRFNDAGHYLMEDAGEDVIERLQSFFAKHPLSADSAT